MAKLHLGQSVAVYERFPNEATFQELASECATANNPEELDRLLAAREKREPDFASRRYWHGENYWLKKSYPRCAVEMKAYLAEIADAPGYQPFQNQARDRLIRSWVKARNSEAALEFLGSEENPPPLLRALALAGGKSGEEAEVFLLDAMSENAWLATMAYRDADLGPLLLGPAFKRLREKHPPPPEKKKPVG